MCGCVCVCVCKKCVLNKNKIKKKLLRIKIVRMFTTRLRLPAIYYFSIQQPARTHIRVLFIHSYVLCNKRVYGYVINTCTTLPIKFQNFPKPTHPYVLTVYLLVFRLFLCRCFFFLYRVLYIWYYISINAYIGT